MLLEVCGVVDREENLVRDLSAIYRLEDDYITEPGPPHTLRRGQRSPDIVHVYLIILQSIFPENFEVESEKVLIITDISACPQTLGSASIVSSRPPFSYDKWCV
jgi:hypothetical protein